MAIGLADTGSPLAGCKDNEISLNAYDMTSRPSGSYEIKGTLRRRPANRLPMAAFTH